MAVPENLQPLWDQLVGEDLSGIVFVRDYFAVAVQPFSPVNVYSRRVVVSSDGRSAAFSEDAFANLAIGLIGRFVREVNVDAPKTFRIVFTDESEIMILLLSEHYQGPEAVDFQGRNNQWALI